MSYRTSVWSRSLWIALWERTGELTNPWGRTRNEYYRATGQQLWLKRQPWSAWAVASQVTVSWTGWETALRGRCYIWSRVGSRLERVLLPLSFATFLSVHTGVCLPEFLPESKPVIPPWHWPGGASIHNGPIDFCLSWSLLPCCTRDGWCDQSNTAGVILCHFCD